MALTLSQIQAITDDIWMPGSYNNWLMGNALMMRLLGNVEKVGSGEYVRFVLEYAKARGGAFGGGTTFDTAKKAFLNAARFPWAMFYSNFTYDIEDEVKISGGEAGVDFVLKGLNNAQSTVRDDMGTSLWQLYSTSQTQWGADTLPFYGVADLLYQSNTSPAFGGINLADLGTYTREGASVYAWLSYLNGNALQMSFTTMQILRRNCIVGEDGAGNIPTDYFTTPTLYDKFEASIVPSQRHYDEEYARIGFMGIKFGTATVTTDNKCSSGDVIALNLNKLVLKAHNDYYFPAPVWKQPTNQAAKTTQLIFVGAFGTGERRAHGKLDDVS